MPEQHDQMMEYECEYRFAVYPLSAFMQIIESSFTLEREKVRLRRQIDETRRRRGQIGD